MQRKKQTEKLLENIQALKRRIFFCTAGKLRSGNIPSSQWFVLWHLNKSEGSTLKDVAEALSMTSSAATQLVEALVQKGYIIRKTSSDDRRELKLMLSEKSKKHMEEFRNNRIKEMENIFGVLEDDEFESYCNSLNKVVENFSNKDKP